MAQSRVLLLLLLLVGAGGYLAFQRWQAGLDPSVVVDGRPMPDRAATLGAPDALESSKWLRERTARYRGFLAKQHCDTLVLPLEVERSAFDRATRLLMAEDVARHVAAAADCTLDPAALDLALGEGLRAHKPEAIAALAHDLNAKCTISLWAGHDSGRSLRVTIQVQGDGAAAKSFDDMSYDGEASPFDVFDRNLGRMLQAVKVETRAPPRKPAGAPAAQLPSSPRSLADIADATPYERAARLTLLGMLAPKRDSAAAERLFVRAYMILAETDGEDAAVRRLRAHILMQLQQRPYAMAAIRDLHGAGSDALGALLDGNLPAASDAAEKVDAPWERLFVTFELQDLELAYQRDSAASQAALLAALGPDWAALLRERRSDVDIWTVADPIAVKQSIERDFPLPGQSLQDIAQGNAIVGDTSRADFIPLALRHVHRVQAEHAAEWCCRGLDAAPSAWDVLDLYDARAERSVARYIYHFVAPQGRPEAALQLLTALEADVGGQPYAEAARARAESVVLEHEQRDRAGHEQRMHAAARVALVADPGQEWAPIWGVYLLGDSESWAHPLANVYCEDFPMRADWNGNVVTLPARLEFSTSEIEPLKLLLQYSKGAQREQLAAELQHRFVGAPEATQLRLQQQAASRPLEPPVLLQAIAGNPDEWPLYQQLSTYYIAHGQYREASELARSFPPLKRDRHNTVEMGNDVYEVARELYYHGATDEARPLLEIVSGFDNGSGASISSRAKLAILDGDYTTAAQAYLAGAQRYNDEDYYRNFLHILFAGGESQTAWSGFEQVAQRFPTENVWIAAMTGHRRDNIGDTALREWIAARPRTAGDQIPAIYALLEQMTDRGVPDAEFVPFVEKIAGASDVHVTPDGHAYARTSQTKQETRVGPSAYWTQRHPGAKLEPTAPNRYALLADAYAKLRARDFAAAARAFDRLASFYDIESEKGWAHALPFFALAASQSGDEFGLKATLATRGDNAQPWDVLLAQAVFAAADGDAKHADALLESAQRVAQVKGAAGWPTPDATQFAEICAAIADRTHDAQLRARALAWGRAMGKIYPYFAWPHALTAHYSSDHAEQVRELAFALYLDPHSAWAAQQPQAMRDEATRRIKSNPPFRLNPPGNST